MAQENGAPVISRANDRIVVKEVSLSDGRTVQIYKATGHDVVKAQRICDNDQSKFTNAYMAIAITIDNQNVYPDELLDLGGGDYLNLMGEFSDVNFTSKPKT